MKDTARMILFASALSGSSCHGDMQKTGKENGFANKAVISEAIASPKPAKKEEGKVKGEETDYDSLICYSVLLAAAWLTTRKKPWL